MSEYNVAVLMADIFSNVSLRPISVVLLYNSEFISKIYTNSRNVGTGIKIPEKLYLKSFRGLCSQAQLLKYPPKFLYFP